MEGVRKVNVLISEGMVKQLPQWEELTAMMGITHLEMVEVALEALRVDGYDLEEIPLTQTHVLMTVEMAKSWMCKLAIEMMTIILLEMAETLLDKLKLIGNELLEVLRLRANDQTSVEMAGIWSLQPLTEMTVIKSQATVVIQHDLLRLGGSDLEEMPPIQTLALMTVEMELL
eukprot:CAMPEP_0197018046 /NCGR_PEP_ID=MMETSP1380-20130617/79880_1 /TAXON_ID=5936 /ORGANISM="Euplotes crassus, Strain CT5" /LENGTH=172 /DNA_ID=CAMNT_0042445215 /DNA_START=377 /DNA_END=895 /DNA_ORIENTATION=-